ncbi:hypothetical protein M0R45_028200 [Rubus argutus]|uniref:Uncharacterized protein n=1 Tax=Rubus argutus TaxID=59490 RepID=A0AAW1W4E9_RUBAR
MAPDQDDAVLPQGDFSSSSQDDEEEDDVVDEDEDDDGDEDDDVINSASPSTSTSLPVAIATPTVTVALPAPMATPTAVISDASDPKRPRTIQYDPVLLPQPEEKKTGDAGRFEEALPEAVDRRGRDRALAGISRLHDAERKQRRVAPKRHRFVLRSDQVQAPAGIQQEPAGREAAEAEKEVPQRPQQNGQRQRGQLQEPSRSGHLRDLPQDLEQHRPYRRWPRGQRPRRRRP